MLFSILVPVYNSEKYLKECFDSVLRQSEQDYELVLVDDGSTDGGGAICDAYQAKFPDRIRVIHQKNQGLILARRAGIRAAQGAYCMFLDADDAYEPECLSTVRETIERTKADVVIFNNYSYFEEDGSIEPNKIVFPDQTEFTGEQKRLIYQELIAGLGETELVASMARLPAHQREALMLRVVAQQSYRQVADALACSENAARLRVSRALHSLKVELSRPAATHQPAATPKGVVNEFA